MARRFHPQIATANHLLEGDAVYFTGKNGWSREFSDATVAQTPKDAENLLERASQFPNLVVGIYLADAGVGPHGLPVPVHFREAFRARGPSNYHHGKQATLPRRDAQPRPARRGREIAARYPGFNPVQPGADTHVRL